MINEADVERAVDFLRDAAMVAAQARANRIYVEHWVKVVKAQEQQRWLATSGVANRSVGASEIYASTTPDYLAALDALKEAVRLDEEQRFLREAASAKIEAWRTMQANERAAR